MACGSVAAASSARPCQRPRRWGLGGGGVPRAPSSDSGMKPRSGVPSPPDSGLTAVANPVDARTAILDRFVWPPPLDYGQSRVIDHLGAGGCGSLLACGRRGGPLLGGSVSGRSRRRVRVLTARDCGGAAACARVCSRDQTAAGGHHIGSRVPRRLSSVAVGVGTNREGGW
jgi:hypothetical protein